MTLPLALIAGIPLGVYKRANEPCCTGWAVHTIPSQHHSKSDFIRIAKRVLRFADEAETTAKHDGVHLLITHCGNRKQINEDLREKCYRVVWLQSDFGKQYGTPLFADALRQLLDFERIWREKIRPNIDSPLLLPEDKFSPIPNAKDVWKRTYRLCQEHDGPDDVANMISRFRKHHRKSSGWRDTKGRLFTHGPLHGTWNLPPWRRRKFTFLLPRGHHFDVSHEKNRQFSLKDADGGPTYHANVDAYGYMRGGT